MHISRKQKYLVLIPFLLIAVAFGLWLTSSVIEEMLVIRSNNQTTVDETTQNNQIPESPNEEIISSSLNSSSSSELPKSTQKKLGLTGNEEEVIYYAYDTTPNDAIYPQWYSTIISAPTGWDTTTGSSSTIVAVVDTGFALDHEDLTSAWWINSGEQGLTQSGDVCWTGSPLDKQTNGCDDDSNGYDDDWRGWDFSNVDNTPQAGQDSSGASHGSKVAGLVGARGNNSIGTVAVNWNTQVMPLQGLFDAGFGYSSDIAEAIVYAVDNGADVINLSLGSPSPDSIILSAIRYADAQNVIVVTSAGNCGDEQSSPQCLGYPSPGGMGYPARYPETIAVGATTSIDVRASFSSWGSELDIVAPGSGTIQTTSWSSSNEISEYATSSYGTSFSSPIVASYVASIKALEPNLSRTEVLAIIVAGADKVPAMGSSIRTDEYGYGRININAGFNSIDSYKQAISKTSAADLESTQAPLISTNIGHSTSSAITNSNQASTYCVSTPNTNCQLKLVKQGTSTVINLGTKKTNTQGIAVWFWKKSNVGSAGTYNATVTSNTLVSSLEKLIVQ